MTELPIILDDLIEKEMQNQIEDAMFDCNWIYHSDNSLGSKTLEMKNREFLSPLKYDIFPFFCADLKSPLNKKIYNKVVPIVQKGCNKINFNVEKIERCYGAIHALMKNKKNHDNIHVNREIPHLVMLYYVNECDGDTILYDKTIDDIPFCVDYPDEYCELNVLHKITPKKGRILFFDGRVYHAPSSPTESIRCIITLDLFGEFEDESYKFPAPPPKPTNNNFIYQ